MNGLGEFDIHVHVVVIAKEVREDGVHRKALKMRQSEKMRADIRLPVGREDNSFVLVVCEGCTEAFIPPAQLFPSAFSHGFILWRVFCIDQMWGVRCEAARNCPFAHVSPIAMRFNSSSAFFIKRCKREAINDRLPWFNHGGRSGGGWKLP